MRRKNASWTASTRTPCSVSGLPGCGKKWVLARADAIMESSSVGAVKCGPCGRPPITLAWLLRFEGRIECIQILQQHRRTEVAREPDRRRVRDTAATHPPRAATALSQIRSR